ncbi:MAG: S8 family serine peptidase [Candidatus Eiseniibacteriota bacterium]
MPDRSPFRWLAAVFAALVLASPAAAQGGREGAAPKTIPGEIIVKYRPGAESQTRSLARAALGPHRKLHDFAFIRAEHLKLEGDLSVEDAIARLESNPNVEYAEPNYEIRALLTPNDPRFPELYAMRNTGQTGGTAGADIRATNAWDLFTGDPNLLIGVIDTGIDYNHPDLAANAWTNPGEIPGNSVDDDSNGFVDDVHGFDFVNSDGDPFDDNGHGTHCAGTIGAVGNNGVGVVGVNWNIKIAGIKFLSAGGSGSTDGAISSVQYAITIGCRLTSNSWGGGGFSQALLDAINAAGAAGQLFVAAAGNAGSNTDVSPHFPSSYDTPYIIAVAATDHNDQLAGFSNFGATTVDLGAPGVDILSCEPGGSYQLLSGTSMATPHVAGACALAWGRFPGASNLQIKQLIMVKADPIPALTGRCVTGARLNVFMAIADPDSTAPGQVTDLATTDPGSTTMGLTWTATGDDGGTGRASRYDIRWSTSAITDSVSFYAANPVEGPDPQPAGSTETVEVAGLTYSTFYYFALRALDEFGNAGPISNVATGTTLGIPNISVTPASLSQTLLTGAQATQQLTVQNTGAGRLDWTAPTPELVFSLARSVLVEETPQVPEMTLAKGEVDPRQGILGSGGPDAFGYRWVDSDEVGGPVFSWVDITGVGTLLTLTGDDATTLPQNIGFSFPFYGNTFSSVRVSTNGFLSFTDGGAPYSNAPFPASAGVPNMVAPFWDDLDFGATPRVYVHNDGARYIVSWVGAPHYQTGGPYTFQAILYPSGEIRYQYLSMGSPTNSATAGIQDGAETIGLNVAFNTAYFHDNLAVQIAPLRQWLTVSPTSGRLHAGNSQLLDVQFDATGLNGGVYDGFVKLFSNDPDGSPSSTPCQLTVIGAPNIVATPANSDFGTQFTGGTYTRTLTVANNGTDALNVVAINVSGSCTAGALTALPGSFSVAPGGFQNVTLSWNPPSPCTLAGSIEIVSDDPDTPSVNVTASGEAVPAPSFSVDPRNFEETLATNTAVSRNMRVENHGGSPLTFSAETIVVSGASDLGTAPRRHVDGDAENVFVAKGQSDSRFGPAPLASGGPDAFGYRWSDSNEPGGPVFSWVDISGVGTAIPFNGDDQNNGPFPIGFSFPYYGATFSTFRVCTNGWISFTSSSTAYSNTTLPNSGTGVPENLVAAFWDDMNFGTSGDAYYYNDGSKLIVQWQAVPRLGETAPNTFQIQLYPDGRILYQYLSITATTRNSHTVGIQNAARNDGLQVVFNNASYVQDNLAVRFSPPARFLTVTPLSGSVPAGGFVDLTVGFNAAGLYGGDYEANVRLTTNDPIVSQYDVPAILHVIGVPDIVAAPDPVDFGTVFIGYPQLRQITVTNTGTDALVVDDVTSSDPAYTPNTTGFTIPPLGQAIVNVNFNPGAVQAYPATLTIKSNDPDTQFLGVDLSGAGIVAPDVTASGGSFLQTLPPDQTASQILSLTNNGGSDLTWTLGASVDAAASSFVIYEGLDLKKDEADPREGILDSGGPDAFGYRWKDSDEPAGPVFGWVDITGTGTLIDGFAADDRLKTNIPLGFSFPFYGSTFTTVNICTNGWMSFTWPDSSFTNDPLPSAGARTPANLVAPFWDDMDLRLTGSVYYHYDGTRFIVSWVGVQHYIGAPGDPTYTFQAILYPSGKIVYQYLSMNDILDSATLGIQNATRDVGLQAVFNAPYVHDNLAIQISRTPDWLSVTPESGTVPAGESRNVSIDFDSQDLEPGTYQGNLRLSSNDPDEGVIDMPVELIVNDLVGVDDPVLPREYGLRLAGANPARGSARLELAMPKAGFADVRIHDVRGALVRSVVNGPVDAGTHMLLWDGTDGSGRKIGAGVYYVSARTSGGSFRKELVLLP